VIDVIDGFMYKALFSVAYRCGVGLILLSANSATADTIKLRLSDSLSKLMTEIRYEEHEPGEPAYLSRFLVLDERVRIDFGRDDEGFILFDRQANRVWHVSPSDRKLTGITSGKIESVWPQDWALSQESVPSESGVLTQVRLNNVLCAEFKVAPLLIKEASLIRDYRRLLAANQAATWQKTAVDMRAPCSLALDVHLAGIEYVQGLPLAIRYWDARSRIYQGHDKRLAQPDLFELPAGYLRVMIGVSDHEKSASRQPPASQTK